jgi:hypothetical protein
VGRHDYYPPTSMPFDFIVSYFSAEDYHKVRDVLAQHRISSRYGELIDPLEKR